MKTKNSVDIVRSGVLGLCNRVDGLSNDNDMLLALFQQMFDLMIEQNQPEALIIQMQKIKTCLTK